MTHLRSLVEWDNGEIPTGKRADLLIGYLSCETRSTTCLRYKDSTESIVFIDCGEKGPVADDNRIRVTAAGGRIIPETEAEACISCCASANGHILLDITSMPRPTIASIVALCGAAKGAQIELSIVYALARYNPPPHGLLHNVEVTPVHPRFAGWLADPHRPLTAIVGLGYERLKALGAVEYLQCSEWWLFSPASQEGDYAKVVDRHNRQLLQTTRASRKVTYDVHAPLSTFVHLEMLLGSLKRDKRPALLPFGPKIFFYLSLLGALVHPEASVWYVRGEAGEPKTERSFSEFLIGLSVQIDNREQEAG